MQTFSKTVYKSKSLGTAIRIEKANKMRQEIRGTDTDGRPLSKQEGQPHIVTANRMQQIAEPRRKEREKIRKQQVQTGGSPSVRVS
jgi:hypothetical protein